MKIIKLSDEFYNDYASCAEILQKRTRPYYCVSVYIDGRHYAIPFRHHIKHKYCFHTVGEAGLDYSKAIVILKRSYIGETNVTVDSAEYAAIKGRESVIENGMRKYIRLYEKSKLYKDNVHYQSIASLSSLQYFF